MLVKANELREFCTKEAAKYQEEKELAESQEKKDKSLKRLLCEKYFYPVFMICVTVVIGIEYENLMANRRYKEENGGISGNNSISSNLNTIEKGDTHEIMEQNGVKQGAVKYYTQFVYSTSSDEVYLLSGAFNGKSYPKNNSGKEVVEPKREVFEVSCLQMLFK